MGPVISGQNFYDIIAISVVSAGKAPIVVVIYTLIIKYSLCAVVVELPISYLSISWVDGFIGGALEFQEDQVILKVPVPNGLPASIVVFSREASFFFLSNCVYSWLKIVIVRIVL